MEIVNLIIKAMSFYSFIIFIRILMTWFSPYNRPGSLTYYLSLIVDPYLNLFRSRYFRLGGLDFSPIIGILTLNVVQSFLTVFAMTGEFRFAYLLVMIVQFAWEYVFQFLFFVLFIILILKLIGLYGSINSLLQIGNFLHPFLYKLSRFIFKDRLVKLSTLVLILLVMSIALYFLSEQIVIFLVNLFIRIPF